ARGRCGGGRGRRCGSGRVHPGARKPSTGPGSPARPGHDAVGGGPCRRARAGRRRPRPALRPRGRPPLSRRRPAPPRRAGGQRRRSALAGTRSDTSPAGASRFRTRRARREARPRERPRGNRGGAPVGGRRRVAAGVGAWREGPRAGACVRAGGAVLTYGRYGGQFVPETLVPALSDLEAAWLQASSDESFRDELDRLGRTYAGRPTPLTLAERFAPGKRLYLKREDLLHTGAHKLNNALGQAVLAGRLGKRRIVAETGAGQHGVATATVCARFRFDCVVYMGEEDMRRQRPNVERMRLLGAEVRGVDFGTKTLKEATSEAIRDWIANVETTHYLIGSCVGPAPYPELVAELQSVIGREARDQILGAQGRLPEAGVACVGGASNALGRFSGFPGGEA